MTTKEFNQERKVTVNVDGEVFEFNSFADMLGNFNDISNSETWANAFHPKNGDSSVFVAHRFDTIGKIVQNHMTADEADTFAAQLNEYFAICEEYNVDEI